MAADAVFAVLNACSHNIRKTLAYLRAWLVWVFAALWTPEILPNCRYLTAGAARKHRSGRTAYLKAHRMASSLRLK
jgi:hypothetical protein